MKAILLTTLTILSLTVFGQDYYVLHIKGVVKKSSGAVLQRNDVIRADDKLMFSSPDDAVAVVSAKSGRFVIKAVQRPTDGEFSVMVKDAINPGVKKLSTRNVGIANVIDFQAYFQQPVLLLNEIRVVVNRSGFPMTSDAFFFIRYTYGKEVINKKLEAQGDTLVIVRSELFAIDGQRIDHTKAKDLSLWYLADKTAKMISAVQVNVPDLAQIKVETKIMRNTAELEGTLDFEEELGAYLNEFYGKIDPLNISYWVEESGARK